MRPVRSALRLRLRRIELKPKPVHVVEFQDFAGIGKFFHLRDELDEIIESIERGDGVPDAHYRTGIDRDEDALLAERGIMHLHLGGKDSDVLVFLIQYADRVAMLETNSHMHFRTRPAGKNIVALSLAWLTNLEREISEVTTRALEMTTEAERLAAEALREKRSAAIKAFKSKAGL